MIESLSPGSGGRPPAEFRPFRSRRSRRDACRPWPDRHRLGAALAPAASRTQRRFRSGAIQHTIQRFRRPPGAMRRSTSATHGKAGFVRVRRHPPARPLPTETPPLPAAGGHFCVASPVAMTKADRAQAVSGHKDSIAIPARRRRWHRCCHTERRSAVARDSAARSGKTRSPVPASRLTRSSVQMQGGEFDESQCEGKRSRRRRVADVLALWRRPLRLLSDLRRTAARGCHPGGPG